MTLAEVEAQAAELESLTLLLVQDNAVPEPGGVLVVAVAAALIAGRRRPYAGAACTE